MLKINGVSQLAADDARVVDSCLRILSSQGLNVPLTTSTAIEGARLINDVIASQDWSTQQKDQKVRALFREAKQVLLPLGEIDWLKKNERACYWAWATISKCQFLAAPNHPVFQHLDGGQQAFVPGYTQLGLKGNPANSKERFDEIVKFFDRTMQPLDWQRLLVAHLKSQWSQIYTARKPFTWLKQDYDDQIRWAWEYICKPKWGENRPPLNGFAPTGKAEMYLAIYAAFDSWGATSESKRLFLIDFNKAWHQKKLRDSRAGAKPCSFVLREEVKGKLDIMATQRSMKLNKLVEELIENEFSRFSQ
jgi:hypothetical protein